MDPLKKLKVGDIIEVTPTFTLNGKTIDQIQEMSGGCPMILQDGSILNTDKVLDHLSSRRPRTAVGIDNTGTKMIMMVVDGDKLNAGISDGITSKELASMMQNAGCLTAINFDGGGSSTIYSEALGVFNRPSDGNLRKVRNGWFAAAPVTTDNTVSTIAFADYAPKLTIGTAYRPLIYGYNSEGYLVNANLGDFQLACFPDNDVDIKDGEILFAKAGVYKLEARSGDAVAAINVTVTDNSGVSTMNAEKEMRLQPAAHGTDMTVSLPYDSDIRLFSSQGVCLYRMKCQAGTIAVPTSRLAPGIYFIATEKETQKFLIK